MVHEYAHAISFLKNPKNIKNENFSEIESYFMELVSNDYFSRKLNTKNFYISEYNDLIDQKDNSNFIIKLSNILNKYLDLIINDTLIKDLPKKEQKKYKIYEEYYDLSSLINLLNLMCSISLFSIYKNDKDKAINMYKNIIDDPNYCEDVSKTLLDECDIASYKNQLVKKI